MYNIYIYIYIYITYCLVRILILYHSFLSGDVVCFFVVYKANKRGSIFWKAVVVPFVELLSHQSLDDLILSFSCLRLHVFWIFWSNLGTRYSRGACSVLCHDICGGVTLFSLFFTAFFVLLASVLYFLTFFSLSFHLWLKIYDLS